MKCQISNFPNLIFEIHLAIKSENNDRLVYISRKCDEKFAELVQNINDKTVVEIQYDFNPMRIL